MYRQLLIGLSIIISALGSYVSDLITRRQPEALTPAKMEAHFIDVGQGDAILFKRGDYEILIDCGDNSSGAKVVSYLRKQKVGNIELLIATHPDEDHIGGCDAVMQNFAVKEVWHNGEKKNTRAYRDFAESAKGSFFYSPLVSTVLDLDGIQVRVVHTYMKSRNTNDNSIVAKISNGSIDFLMAGDCEQECEASISPDFDLSSEILKAGHHGSATSTTADFLARVRPEIAVISVGAGNRYRHPAQSTLDRFANLRVYRTDVSGDVVISTDGISYSSSIER